MCPANILVNMTDDDPLISYAEMARRAGVTPGTMRSLSAQRYLPAPDDTSVSDRPRWRLSTFERWITSRLGPGRRAPDASDDPLLSITEMAQLMGIHRQRIYALRSKGEFPTPDDTVVRTRPRWRKSTFEQWMAFRPKSSAHATSGGKQASGQTGIGNQKDDQSNRPSTIRQTR